LIVENVRLKQVVYLILYNHDELDQ